MRVLFVFLLLSCYSIGQKETYSDEESLPKNFISANIGTWIIAHNIGMVYERVLPNFLNKEKERFNVNSTVSLSLNRTHVEFNLFGKEIYRTAISYISFGRIYDFKNTRRKTKIFVEWHLGIGGRYNLDSEAFRAEPVLKFGLRFQPRQNFFFKIIGGSTELTSFGLGVCF